MRVPGGNEFSPWFKNNVLEFFVIVDLVNTKNGTYRNVDVRVPRPVQRIMTTTNDAPKSTKSSLTAPLLAIFSLRSSLKICFYYAFSLTRNRSIKCFSNTSSQNTSKFLLNISGFVRFASVTSFRLGQRRLRSYSFRDFCARIRYGHENFCSSCESENASS